MSLRPCVLLFVVATFSYVKATSLGEFVNGTDDKTSNFLTPQQRYLTKQFANQNGHLLKDDYAKTESHVVGWLRANKWNFNNAAKMLRRGQSWRAVNKVEDLGKAELSSDMEILFPFRLEAKDEQGCPVLEVDLGQWDITTHMQSAIFARDAVESFAKHTVQMWEKSRLALIETAKQCAQIVLLQDMQTFLPEHMADTNSIAAVVKMITNLESYYPNLIKEAHIINCAPESKKYFETIKPYLSQSTVNVLNLYSETDQEWQDHVLLSIDPEQLPPRYGGVKGLF
jgi:hypothetical protein